jgi:phosphoglucomutase
VSVVRKGQEGAAEIKQMMVDFRANPPKQICGSDIVAIKDYQNSTVLNPATGAVTPLEIDKSNVLQYLTADGTILSIRPSGTEPKIKFYFGVKEPLASLADYDKVSEVLDHKIERMKKELNLV